MATTNTTQPPHPLEAYVLKIFEPFSHLKTDNKLYRLYGRCAPQAILNKHDCYKNKDLRLVCGSLGFGMRAFGDVWYLYGNGDPKFDSSKPTPHSIQSSQLTHSKGANDNDDEKGIDAHVWLEDVSGNVYDVFHLHYLLLADEHYKYISMKELNLKDKLTEGITWSSIIENKSKTELSKYGLHYVPATEHIQLKILDVMLTHYNKIDEETKEYD